MDMNFKYEFFRNQYLVVNKYNEIYSLIRANFNEQEERFYQQWGTTKEGKRPFGITIGKYQEDADKLIEFIQRIKEYMPSKNNPQTTNNNTEDDIPF